MFAKHLARIFRVRVGTSALRILIKLMNPQTKKCTLRSCTQINPQPLSEFHKNKNRRDGLCDICKVCYAAYNKVKVEVTCESCKNIYFMGAKTFRGSASKKHRRLCLSCTRQDISARSSKQIGPTNPNWKNGATSEADKFYSSKKWKEIRTQAFIRDKYTCVDCGQVGRKLEANHIQPRSRFPELKLELNNLETLCKKCHDGKKWMVYRS